MFLDLSLYLSICVQAINECNLRSTLLPAQEVASPLTTDPVFSHPLSSGQFSSILHTTVDTYHFLFAGTDNGKLYQVRLQGTLLLKLQFMCLGPYTCMEEVYDRGPLVGVYLVLWLLPCATLYLSMAEADVSLLPPLIVHACQSAVSASVVQSQRYQQCLPYYCHVHKHTVRYSHL